MDLNKPRSGITARVWEIASALSSKLGRKATRKDVIKACEAESIDIEAVAPLFSALGIRVMPFDEAHARKVGSLRNITRTMGLSLGDRACLATTLIEACRGVRADRIGLKRDLGLEIVSVR